jgi:hypothetical protein
VPRRDESAKRAHSLVGEVTLVWFHSQEFSQRGSQEGAQTTNTDEKRMRDCGPRLRFYDGSDGPTAQVDNSVQHSSLCVERELQGGMNASTAPICEVSNRDQLFRHDGLMMIFETSTSSLSFRSSELSQLSEVFSS